MALHEFLLAKKKVLNSWHVVNEVVATNRSVERVVTSQSMKLYRFYLLAHTRLNKTNIRNPWSDNNATINLVRRPCQCAFCGIIR